MESWRRDNGAPRSVFSAAGELGFLGTAVPERFGGGGAEDYGFLATLIEQTVDVGATGLAVLWALHAGVTIPFLLEHGDPDVQQRWVPDLAAGTLIGVPAPGINAPALPGGRLADVVLLNVDDSVTIVPTDAEGVAVSATPGLLGAPDSAISDLDATAAQLTDWPTPAVTATSSILPDIDLWLAVVAVATARRAVELAVEYVESRKVFGKLLAEFENTQLRIAELTAELAAATKYVDACLNARADATLTPAEAACGRYVAVRLCDHAVDQSLQLHGGYGYMREYPIAQAFADARFLRTLGRSYSDPRQTVARPLFNGA